MTRDGTGQNEGEGGDINILKYRTSFIHKNIYSEFYIYTHIDILSKNCEIQLDLF